MRMANLEVASSVGVTAALQVLDGEWDALADADPGATVFQTGCWCRGWVEAVAAVERQIPVILRWRRAGTLVGGVALQIGPDADGEHVLTALGSPWADYNDVIGNFAELGLLHSAHAEIAAIAAQFRVRARFREVRPAGTLAQILTQLPTRRRPSTPTVAIDLRDGERLARLLRQREYRLKRRRLDRLGDLQLQHYSSPGDVAQWLPRFIALHLAQWHGRADAVAPFDDAVVRDGFRAIASSTAKRGLMRLTVLQLGPTLLAGYFGFVWKNCYYAYRTAYDRSWFRYSPGHLMLRGMLADFAGAGIERFDLMRGAYNYKAEYASHVEANCLFETDLPERDSCSAVIADASLQACGAAAIAHGRDLAR